MDEINLSKIEKMIFIIRGQKVMLDSDLAILSHVETKVLNQAVKRNRERFPEDFMFQLSRQEYILLDDSGKHGGRSSLPFAFTENGVAMLSSVLQSPNAIQINISIMRIFTRLRSFNVLEKETSQEVKELEKNVGKVFQIVFERLDSIEEIITPQLPKNRKEIGIHSQDQEE